MDMKLTHEQEVIERIKQSDGYRNKRAELVVVNDLIENTKYVVTAQNLLEDKENLERCLKFVLSPNSTIYKRISREHQQRQEIATTHLNWKKSNV